jgi:D-glycero-alpha-D-manno-heptose-7-phosphate kinase
LPARTGIGSSSSFTVGLIHSLNALQKKNINKKELSDLAISFEQEILKETVGSQDQVIVSYGGFRSINFEKKKITTNLIDNKNFINKLEKWCQVFYLGNQRSASKLEDKKFEYMNKKKNLILQNMMDITKQAESLIFSKNKNSFYDFIKLLDEQWKLKKSLNTAVSSVKINEMYEFSKKHGAISGKILGAGGGGFFLLITPPQYQRSIEKKIKLSKVNIKFENNGSQIILNSKD